MCLVLGATKCDTTLFRKYNVEFTTENPFRVCLFDWHTEKGQAALMLLLKKCTDVLYLVILVLLIIEPIAHVTEHIHQQVLKMKTQKRVFIGVWSLNETFGWELRTCCSV